MNPNFKGYLLKVTKSLGCEEIEIIQSLWSGYGRVSRYRMDNSQHNTVVVKSISLNQSGEHPRGWSTDFSHNRKVESYKVETNWYEKRNMQCSSNCRTPKFLGSFLEGNNQWIILEDLNLDFPIRKQELDLLEIKVCLKWLANFHVNFLSQTPKGLWEVGTYWNLETRPDEFEKIENQELKLKAELIDDLLNKCKYQTIVHGDAKLANFCFSEEGDRVAAVDFQYVGGGCGIKDVAYFLGSCLSSSECELFEIELLDYYFSELEKASELSDFSFKELEEEWRGLYPVACTDFTRFLLGWMPSHQKVNNYNLNIMKSVLLNL
jgi:hypothetical protein